eukprot:3105844-Rhodomonas_salina.1
MLRSYGPRQLYAQAEACKRLLKEKVLSLARIPRMMLRAAHSFPYTVLRIAHSSSAIRLCVAHSCPCMLLSVARTHRGSDAMRCPVLCKLTSHMVLPAKSTYSSLSLPRNQRQIAR